MIAPILETERLRLRGYRLEDFPIRRELWLDPRVLKYIHRKPQTESEAWASFLVLVGHWEMMGFGYWVVEEKSSGRFVGEIGFADFKREIEPSIAGVPEIGWVIAPEHHGKGYASEGVRAALAWGDSHFDSGRTVCIIDPENAASLRVAEKHGYREETRTLFRGDPAVLLARK